MKHQSKLPWLMTSPNTGNLCSSSMMRSQHTEYGPIWVLSHLLLLEYQHHNLLSLHQKAFTQLSWHWHLKIKCHYIIPYHTSYPGHLLSTTTISERRIWVIVLRFTMCGQHTMHDLLGWPAEQVQPVRYTPPSKYFSLQTWQDGEVLYKAQNGLQSFPYYTAKQLKEQFQAKNMSYSPQKYCQM